MDHRTLFGLAAVLLSTSILINSLQSANAVMPVGMQHGQFPYEHFTECDLPGANVSTSDCSPATGGIQTLLSVPSDRIFIVTGAVTSDTNHCWFLNDGIPIYSRNFIEKSKNGPLLNGNANIVIPAGSELQVNIYQNYASSCDFFIEGYYAHL